MGSSGPVHVRGGCPGGWEGTGLEAWDGVMSAQHRDGGPEAVDLGWATLQTPDRVTASPLPHPQ